MSVPEPDGIGAVVACTYEGRRGYAVSFSPHLWVFDGSTLTDYAGLDDPRVISYGTAGEVAT